jgi:2-polyprenyl-3-methyl-5-hydroxy-6-metoxy-1,4-benzoquinol methylase
VGRLGGHFFETHIDRGTLGYLIQSLPIKTMIDVGCGPGGMVEVAREMGLKAVGVDGDPVLVPDIRHNFEHGPLSIEPTDLAWSVEFLEHVEEQYLDNVFSVFDKCKYVFCTHNPKPGPWHSNCQSNEYWIETFENRGFGYDPMMTLNIKQHSTMKREFVQKTGTFFINECLHCR